MSSPYPKQCSLRLPDQTLLASGGCGWLRCLSIGSYHWARNLWVLITYLFFLPVMLPSEVPRLTTDSQVRVFPGVWKLLSFLKTPFLGLISVPTSFVSFLIFYIFFLPPFKDNGLLFWVPDVLCQHSVVLWNLLSVQMFFWWLCGGESGLPVLFLCHLRTASSIQWFCFTF